MRKKFLIGMAFTLALAALPLACGSEGSPSTPANGTPSPQPSPSPTACLSCTPTFTATATATETPASTPTPSATATVTDTPTPTATVTFTPTVTLTPCTNTGSQGDAPTTACCAVGTQKNYTYCRPITLAQASQVYQIQLYVSGPCSFVQAGLYADNGSHYPGNRVAQSAPVSVSGTASQVYSFSLPATTLNAGTYWMAVYGNDPGAFIYLNLSPSPGDSYTDTTGIPVPAVFEASTGSNYVTDLIQMQAQYCY